MNSLIKTTQVHVLCFMPHTSLPSCHTIEKQHSLLFPRLLISALEQRKLIPENSKLRKLPGTVPFFDLGTAH